MNILTVGLIIGAILIGGIVVYFLSSPSPTGNETDSDTKQSIKKIRKLSKTIETIETINNFLSQSQERIEKGKEDAANGIPLELGILSIKRNGIINCDAAILAYEEEIKRLNDKIDKNNKRLDRLLEGSSEKRNSDDNTKNPEKEIIDDKIKYIEAKKKELENTKEGIYVDYRTGYMQVIDKIEESV